MTRSRRRRSRPATKDADCARPILHATMSFGPRSVNSISRRSTRTGCSPPRSTASVAAVTVPHAAIAAFICEYHDGRSQPTSPSAGSTAAFAGWSSSAAYVDASNSRPIRPASRTPWAGSSRWFNENGANTTSKESSRNGNATASPAVAGGRRLWSTRSMSTARSVATTRAPAASAARDPSPVPLPRSSTDRPRNDTGLKSTSSSASRRYTRVGPSAHAAAPSEYASATGSEEPRSFEGPVAPPAELVVVAERLLPTELDERRAGRGRAGDPTTARCRRRVARAPPATRRSSPPSRSAAARC